MSSSARVANASPIAASANSWPFGPSTSLQAAVGKRDVGGDDDVAFPGALSDAVVRRVEATLDHDEPVRRVAINLKKGG